MVVTTTKSDHLLLHFFAICSSLVAYSGPLSDMRMTRLLGRDRLDVSKRFIARSSARCRAIRVSSLAQRASAGVSESNNGPEANGVLLGRLTVPPTRRDAHDFLILLHIRPRLVSLAPANSPVSHRDETPNAPSLGQNEVCHP